MKRIGALIFVISILLLAACSYSDQMKNHPAKALLAEENPENPEDASVKRRYDSNTEGTCYTSYSVYKDLTEQQMEQIADFIELGYVAAPDRTMQKNEDGRYEYRISIAFYKGDSDELIDAFIFKGGKRQEPSESDYFISGDRFGYKSYE